jgi:tetratricopeptide (TPR) repeat protein
MVNRALRYHDEGVEFARLGQIEESVAAYDKAIAIRPDYIQAWGNRGNALVRLSLYEEAVASYEKVIAIDPNDALSWKNRGNALFNLGRYEESVASYDKAIAIDPKNAAAWFHRGVALGKLGKHAEAIDSFDRTTAIDPNDTLAWKARGNALGKLGRFLDALASYDKAIVISPKFFTAWNSRGNVLSALGRYFEAVDSYDKALAIKPDFDRAKQNRGIAHKKQMDGLKKGDNLPLFGKHAPLWRQFEDASPQERESMVESYEWWESSDGKDIAVRFYGKKVRLHGFGGIRSSDAYAMLESVKWEKAIPHSKIWISLRKSFYGSNDWKQFRIQWLQKYPVCVRCGRTDVVLQVHHAGQYSLDNTVIDEGFLEGLKHSERFETLCVECHYHEHKPLILHESVSKGTTAEILAQKKPKNEREVMEKEKLLFLSLVNPCVDWAKKHGLKKVTEANVDAFLFERDIDLSPRTRRRSLRASVNSIIESTVL